MHDPWGRGVWGHGVWGHNWALSGCVVNWVLSGCVVVFHLLIKASHLSHQMLVADLLVIIVNEHIGAWYIAWRVEVALHF